MSTYRCMYADTAERGWPNIDTIRSAIARLSMNRFTGRRNNRCLKKDIYHHGVSKEGNDP